LNSIDQNETTWPIVAEEDLIEDQINLVVQVNGKKRAILKVKRNISEKEILKIIKLNKEVEKFLTKEIFKKIIFVPNRLINIII
jgi:leucyl-tRNA synthetase